MNDVKEPQKCIDEEKDSSLLDGCSKLGGFWNKSIWKKERKKERKGKSKSDNGSAEAASVREKYNFVLKRKWKWKWLGWILL